MNKSINQNRMGLIATVFILNIPLLCLVSARFIIYYVTVSQSNMFELYRLYSMTKTNSSHQDIMIIYDTIPTSILSKTTLVCFESWTFPSNYQCDITQKLFNDIDRINTSIDVSSMITFVLYLCTLLYCLLNGLFLVYIHIRPFNTMKRQLLSVDDSMNEPLYDQLSFRNSATSPILVEYISMYMDMSTIRQEIHDGMYRPINTRINIRSFIRYRCPSLHAHIQYIIENKQNTVVDTAVLRGILTTLHMGYTTNRITRAYITNDEVCTHLNIQSMEFINGVFWSECEQLCIYADYPIVRTGTLVTISFPYRAPVDKSVHFAQTLEKVRIITDNK